MPPVTPSSTRAIRGLLRLVVVLDLALADFLETHRQIVLRARFHEGRELVEGAFAELVVVVVDLPSPLRGDDHERVARVDLLEQLIDAWMDHTADMVPATTAASSRAARSRSSLTTTWSKRPACASCFRASSSRSSISPALSVARSRS